jgi:general secretion pathway protein H
MIVLVILGFGLTLAVNKITNKSGELRAVLRKTVVLSRELHTRAKLNGVTYRLVIDLGEGGPHSHQKLYVEKGSDASVITEDSSEENLHPADSRDKEEAKTKSAFVEDNDLLKEPIEIPPEVYIAQVELNRVEKPVTRGLAYIHYLPQGLVEEAAIHLQRVEGEQRWTISIAPLTGRAEVVSPSMTLKELKSQ